MTDDQFRDRLLDAVERIHDRIEAVRAELRTEMRDARSEQAEDHKQVKQRLQSLEQGQTTIVQRIGTLETHEEADLARQEGAEGERAALRRRRAWVASLVVGAAAVTSALSALAFGLIGQLK